MVLFKRSHSCWVLWVILYLEGGIMVAGCAGISLQMPSFKDVEKKPSQHHVWYHTDCSFLLNRINQMKSSDLVRKMFFFSTWHLWLPAPESCEMLMKMMSVLCPLKQLNDLKTVGGSNLRPLHSDVLTQANRTNWLKRKVRAVCIESVQIKMWAGSVLSWSVRSCFWPALWVCVFGRRRVARLC